MFHRNELGIRGECGSVFFCGIPYYQKVIETKGRIDLGIVLDIN